MDLKETADDYGQSARRNSHGDGRLRVRAVDIKNNGEYGVNMSRLANKVAIVTGASKGIGSGIATALAAEQVWP